MDHVERPRSKISQLSELQREPGVTSEQRRGARAAPAQLCVSGFEVTVASFHKSRKWMCRSAKSRNGHKAVDFSVRGKLIRRNGVFLANRVTSDPAALWSS